MKIQIKNKIGEVEYLFEVEDENDLEALQTAAFLGTPHQTCGMCKSGNLTLSANRAKGFLFIKIRCLDCNARRQLGQYKEGGYFWKDWEKYEPKGGAPAAPPEEYNAN